MSEKWRDDLDKWFHGAAGRYVTQHLDDDPPFPDTLKRVLDRRELWAWLTRESEIQSPIEAILFAYVLFCSDGYQEVQVEPFPGRAPPPDFGTVVMLQQQIGRHRVDFLFTCHAHGHSRRLIVECDGHDFHDRTKEQAARDKSRDRDLIKDGATVVRYTGSELYRDPVKCIEEIETILSDLIEDCLAAAGVIAGRRK